MQYAGDAQRCFAGARNQSRSGLGRQLDGHQVPKPQDSPITTGTNVANRTGARKVKMTHEQTSTESTGDDGLTPPSQLLAENPNPAKPLDKPIDRYRRLYEQAPLGYQSLDDAGCFIEVNQAFLDALGYTREEVIGHWFGDFLAPDMVDAFRERFPKFKAIGTTRVDFQMKHKNGSLRIMTIDGRVDYEEDGRFKQTHCVLQDITDRKHAEDALRDSEAKFRTLFEQMTQGVFYQQPDGSYDDVNPAALAMFGLTREQFLGIKADDPNWKVITPDGTVMRADQYPSNIAIQTGKPVTNVLAGLYRPDIADYVWLNISAIPQFKPGQDQPYRAFVTLHDVTRQKKAEEELRASEQRFRNILEKVQLIAIELDTQGHVAFCNDYLLTLTGWKMEEILGENWFERFLPTENRSSINELFNHTLNKLEFPVTHENPIQTRDGRLLHIRWNNVLIYDHQDQPSSIVSLGEDITDSKRAESELRRMHTLLNNTQAIAQIGGWEYDVATGKVTWTDEVYRIHGVPLDYDPLAIGKDYIYYPKESSHAIWDAMDRAVEHGEPYDLEVEMVRSDGQRRWIRTMAKPFFENGKITRLLGNIQDITDRKKAEADLKRIHTLLNDAQAIARIGGWECDVATGKITWTDEVYNIHGVGHDYDPNNIASDFRFYATESSAILWSAFDNALKTGAPYDLELELFPANGGRLWVRATARAVFKDDKVVRLLGYIQDITSRKQAEEQYQTLFREMLEGFALHEIICDDQGKPVDYRFLDVNPAFERMTGLRAGDILGKTVLQVLPGTESHWIETYGQVAIKGTPIQFDNVSQDLDRHFEVAAFQPAPNQFACIFSDITKRKQAEHKLNEQLDELRRWQAVTLGREGRVLALKHEINELLGESGRPPRYASAKDEKQND